MLPLISLSAHAPAHRSREQTLYSRNSLWEQNIPIPPPHHIAMKEGFFFSAAHSFSLISIFFLCFIFCHIVVHFLQEWGLWKMFFFLKEREKARLFKLSRSAWQTPIFFKAGKCFIVLLFPPHKVHDLNDCKKQSPLPHTLIFQTYIHSPQSSWFCF